MKRSPRSISALLICVTLAGVAFAQGKDYKPGEKIECKTSYSKDDWGPCTFVGKSYDGSQPIIRDDQGFQKGLPDWTWVRPAAAKPANDRARNNQPAAEDVNKQNAANVVKRDVAARADAAPAGQGLMSQADVINFLKTRLGPDPFANPRRYEIKDRLAEEIKRRGLNFRFEAVSPFFDELSKYIGVTSDISNPLKDNYGPPTKQSWLLGTWKLDVVGATTEYEANDRIWRKEASAAANIGRLTVNADGTYIWQASAPAKTFRGQWRKATAEEMKTQGGDGIVLLKAKEGWDWIVTQNRRWAGQGDLIWVSDLNTRQMREIGSRGGTR